VAEFLGASFGRNDPWAIHPRRVVPDVLRVPALELGDPVAVLVLVIADDAPVHERLGVERAQESSKRRYAASFGQESGRRTSREYPSKFLILVPLEERRRVIRWLEAFESL
jgi:hypothetical protein